jgi:single-stranded DNA-specific DHH superfamily exonuclease
LVTETNYSFEKKDLERIKTTNNKFVIILDIPTIPVEVLTELTKFYKVMIIDHHKPKGYVRVCYINPRIYDDNIYAPTTYITYKIYESFFNPKDVLWITCIGVLGDHGVESCKDVFTKLRKVKPELFDNTKLTSDDLFKNSKLGKLVKMIDAARIVSVKNVDKVFKIICAAKGYKEIEKSVLIRKLFESVEKEFEKNLKEFEKGKKIFDKIVFYEIKSKYNLKSSFAGYIQTLFKDKIICVAQKFGNYYEVSFRRGEELKVDLSELAESLAATIKGANGGGHSAASAIRFPAGKFKIFLKKLEKINF